MEKTAQPFAPIVIRYDGLDAERHEIDLYDFGKSAQGIAKIISAVASFAVTKNYDPSRKRLECHVTVREPRANCFSLTAIIQMIDGSPLAYTVSGGAFLIVFQYLWALITGRSEEMRHLQAALMSAIEQLGRKDEVNRLLDMIDKMAVGLVPAAKQAVRPIGRTCELLSFGDGKAYYTQLNEDDKRAINNEVFDITETNSYRVLISELDMKKYTCKVSLRDSLDTRFNARILDPQIEIPNNKYALAHAAKNIVTVKAKQKVIKGIIREFIISDIEYDPQKR